MLSVNYLGLKDLVNINLRSFFNQSDLFCQLNLLFAQAHQNWRLR